MSPSITISPLANTSKSSKSIYTRQQKKPKMSVTQTYFLAHSARGKLSREAARADHDLRLLVGHANMLDSLMLDLANVEQEQEKWFNRSVLGADVEPEEEEEEEEEVVVPAYPETIVEETEIDWSAEEEDQTSDDDSDDEELTLARTISHHSPPELTTSDSDSDSEDDHMPPSPETSTIDLITQKERQALMTSSYYEVKETPISPTEEEDAILFSTRNQPTIIAAY